MSASTTGRTTHHIETTHFLESGYVNITLVHTIQPFVMCIKISHDFYHQITQFKSIKIKHRYFNVVTNMSHNSSTKPIFNGVMRIIEGNMDLLSRDIVLEVNITSDKETQHYCLSVKFVKAPSLLHNKTFKISNIMDHYSLLKHICFVTVLKGHDIYMNKDVLSLIFDVFLSKLYWTHPSNDIFYSSKLNQNVTKRFSTGSLQFIKYVSNMSNKIKSYPIYPQKLKNVKYVSSTDHHTARDCNINGIGINIKIKDESINSTNYKELFDIFKKYQLYEPDLNTIWTKVYDTTLGELGKIYDGIDLYCNDKKDKIEVNAQLLIDKNINDQHIAMILVKWEDVWAKMTEHDHWIINTEFIIKRTYRKQLNPDRSHSVDFDQLQIARDFCHNNFKDSVKEYEKLIKLLFMEEIKAVIEDREHFGEPIIALRNVYGEDNADKIIRNDDRKLHIRWIYRNRNNKKNKCLKTNKKGRSTISYRQKNKIMKQLYPKKVTKYLYHRW